LKERNVLDFFRIIYRRKRTILVIVISSLLTAVILSKKLPPVYEGTVTLLPPSKSSGYSLESTLETAGVSSIVTAITKEALQNYIGILKSLSVAKDVASKVPKRSLRQIRKNSKFDINDYNLFEIVVHDKNPELASKIANAYAVAFNNFFTNVSGQEIEKVRTFTGKQFELTKEKLASAEEELKAFKEGHETVSLDEETTKIVSEYAELEAKRRALIIDIQENEIQLSSTEKLLAKQTQMQKYSEITAQNPIFQQLKSELVSLDVQLAGTKRDYGESHLKVITLQSQIDEVTKQLKAEMEKLVTSETSRIDPLYENLTQNFISLQVSKNSLQARKEASDIVIKQIKTRLLELPERSLKYARLLREAALQESIYNMLALKLEDAKIQEAYEKQAFVIIDSASVPEKPAFPLLIYNIIAALGFSLVGSIFFCFLLEYIDELRKSNSDY